MSFPPLPPPLPSPAADVPALPRLDSQEQCQRVEEHLCKVMEISCDVEELILLSRKLYYKMLLAFLQAQRHPLPVLHPLTVVHPFTMLHPLRWPLPSPC